MYQKLLVLLSVFLCYNTSVYAQWQWSIRGGSVNSMNNTNDYNNINQMGTDQAGNIYILAQIGGAGVKVGDQSLTAYSGIFPGASLDILLSSFTSDGTFRWSKVIGGQIGDLGHSLKADGLGNIYVAGRIWNIDDNPVGPPNTAVHFDTDTVLPKIPYDSNFSVIPDTLNQIMFLAKYDTAGTMQWLRIPEPDTTSRLRGNFPFRMDVDASGNIHWWCYLKPGEFRWANNNVITQEGIYILKYNAQGQVTGRILLDMEIGGLQYWGPYGTGYFAIHPTNGNYYIAGTNNGNTYLTIGGDTITSDMYIACFSPTGQLLWKKTSGGVDIGNIEDFQLDDSGNLYLTGYVRPGTELGGHTYTSPRGSSGPYISVFDANGNHQWSNMAVVNAASGGYGVAVSDSEVAVAGYGISLYWPNNTDSVKTKANQGYDAFLARFDKSNGELITMERTNTPFGGASYGNAVAAGPQDTYYLGGNFDMALYLGQDTLYKVGSQRSFFLSQYQCEVPQASFSVSGTNSTNTLNLTYTGAPADSVQWYLGDGTRLWGDSVQHSYATKGKYRVCAMAYFECTEVTVCDSLSAGSMGLEEESFAELEIYPNPTNGILNLENLPKNSLAKLYNLNGKLLLQQAFKEGRASLDLSQFSNGVYLLELQNNSGERLFRKVMMD